MTATAGARLLAFALACLLVLSPPGGQAHAATPSGTSVDTTVLLRDAEACDVAALRTALAVGTGIAQLDAPDGEGRTPLSLAAREGCLMAVSTLVHAGASLERADAAGWTALHHAASQRHADVVDYLLAHGAAQEPRTNNGETPLALAVVGSREQFGPRGDGHLTEMVLLSGHPRAKFGAMAKAPAKPAKPRKKRKATAKPVAAARPKPAS